MSDTQLETKRPPRSKSEKERDLRREAEMYLQGKSQQEISSKLNLSPATVSRDLKSLQDEWKNSRLYDMDAAKNKELARIDVLEREYWKGWDRSQKIAHSSSEAIDGPGSTVELNQKRQQFGDPRFLNGIMSCIQKRCEILGLNAPKDVNLTASVSWLQKIGAANPTGIAAPGVQITTPDPNVITVPQEQIVDVTST